MMPNTSMILPVILCGGFGKRLAPLSTPDKPKQFHALLGEENSLFQETMARLSPALFLAPVIFGNRGHEALIESQLREAGVMPDAVFLEPFSRNTAAPVILSALYAARQGVRKILVLPSDHVIEDRDSFYADVALAAGNGAPVTYFGIRPDAPSSLYGYVLQDGQGGMIFHEKPDAALAGALIEQGALWNSGIFLIDVEAFLTDMEFVDAPLLAQLRFILLKPYLFEEDYRVLPDIAFDKVYCEKSRCGSLIRASFDWCDLGSWEVWESRSALARLSGEESNHEQEIRVSQASARPVGSPASRACTPERNSEASPVLSG